MCCGLLLWLLENMIVGKTFEWYPKILDSLERFNGKVKMCGWK